MSKVMIQCPQCKAEFGVESSQIGQPVTCPFCYRKFVAAIRLKLIPIPKTESKLAQPQAAAPEAKIPLQLEEVPEEIKPSGSSSGKFRKGLFLLLGILSGLSLLVAGGYYGYQYLLTEKNKAEEEARIKAEKEARIKAEEEARIKAEEEARIKAEEEARIKAEEERAREEKRKAMEKRELARKERQEAEAEKESDEKKRLSGLTGKLLQAWVASNQQNNGNKLFLAVTVPVKSNLLLFRYDDELENPVDKIFSARALIVRYNRKLQEAVFEDSLGDRQAVTRLSQESLMELERRSGEAKHSIMDLSEKIAYLAARKKLLVKKFELPEDGCMEEEIPPGKYLIVYLPEKEIGCEYIFEKEEKVPLALVAWKNGWHNVSGHYQYIWDSERSCYIEVNRKKEKAFRVMEERDGRFRVKKETAEEEEKKEKKVSVDQAIAKAEKMETYDESIEILEKVIKQYPGAENVDQAKKRLMFYREKKRKQKEKEEEAARRKQRARRNSADGGYRISSSPSDNGGSNMIRCPACGGSGSVAQSGFMPGMASVGGIMTTCSTCSGSGRIRANSNVRKCPYCGGSGSIRDVFTGRPVQCDRCEGSGYIR